MEQLVAEPQVRCSEAAEKGFDCRDEIAIFHCQQ